MKTLLRSLTLTTVALGSFGAATPTPTWTDPHAGLGPLAYTSRVDHGRRLLAYDRHGDGRVVEVLGDLDTADHVAVVVPGSGHRLDNFGTSRSGAAPLRNGRRLLAEMHRQAPAARVAVVVWLGYDPPERLDYVAVRSARASAGGHDLARLTWQLPRRAALTLVGHSYGSVVVGRAAPGARADNLVLVASPGVDVGTAAELGTTATVWAARGPADPIAFVPSIRIAGVGHGADPTGSGFGARTFGTGAIVGHDHYYEPGSESLANIARIAAGVPGLVTPPSVDASTAAGGVR